MALSVEERRARLRNRTQESSQDRGQQGLGKVIKVPLDFSLVEGPIVWYELTADPRVKNMIDIIPFEVSRPEYLALRQFTGKPVNRIIGDWDYKLEISVHQKIGIKKESVLCLREMFGMDCPICNDMFNEWRKRKEDPAAFNERQAKALQPQWRCVYVVYDYRDEAYQGFKLWDCAYKTFEELLAEKAETSTDGYVVFSDPFDGKVIEIEARNEKIGKNDYIKPVTLQFLDRQTPYTEAEIQNNYPLDVMLIIPSYEQVCEMYYSAAPPTGMKDDEPEQPATDQQPVAAGRTAAGAPPVSRRGAPAIPPAATQTAPPARRSPATASPPPQPTNECMAGGRMGIDLHSFEQCQAACPEEIFQRCNQIFEARKASATDPAEPPIHESGTVMTPEVEARLNQQEQQQTQSAPPPTPTRRSAPAAAASTAPASAPPRRRR